MKHLKTNMIIGTLFVLILGTLSHFFYEWSNQNFFVGLVSPVNESTWEHMKLLFFPMLLYALITIPRLGKSFPRITSSLLTGILLGTLLIPVLFYTYSGILGRNILAFDIAVFAISVIAAFYASYRLTLSRKAQQYTPYLWIAVCIFIICFIVFTCNPPEIGLFTEPAQK